MSNFTPKSEHWLPVEDWRKVQRCLPIVCVDVLPIRRRQGELRDIGLVFRETPHQGRQWCLIGGRLQYNELLTEGVERELREALGDKIIFTCFGSDEPLKVAQYLPTPDKGELYDPRQHALALTYVVELSGEITPQGEALEFSWFPVAGLAEMQGIGFGQQPIIIECLQRLEGLERTIC